jgi:tryptophan synthase beta chain
MYTLGHNFVAPPLHAGGLRYHGMAPLVSQATVEGLLEPMSIPQLECYAAAVQWARTEGTICAPETSHAIAATIRQAKQAKEEGKEKVILFNYSGHGMLDLAGYDSYLNGRLEDYEIPQSEFDESVDSSLAGLPEAQKKRTGKW